MSAIGTAYGADQTFTTPALPSTATTPTPTPAPPAVIPPSSGPRPKCSIRLASDKVLLSAPKSSRASKIESRGLGRFKPGSSAIRPRPSPQSGGERGRPGKPAGAASFELSARKASAKRGAALTITLRLPHAALTGLEQRLRETVQLTLVARDGNGTTTRRTNAAKLTAGES